MRYWSVVDGRIVAVVVAEKVAVSTFFDDLSQPLISFFQ